MLKVILMVFCCTAANVKVGSESSTEVTDPGGAVRCTSVFCKNGTFTFGLEQRITEEHGDCEPGIYDMDDRFLQDVDKSKLLNHQSLTINICPREFRLKMQCTSKEKNIEACFRIDDTNSDIQGSNPRDGAANLWLLLLIPGAALMIGLAIVIRNQIKKWKPR